MVELMVALAITLLMVSFFLGFTTNSLKQVNRAVGVITTENQASLVLENLDRDLGSAVIRRDGRVWLAATVQPDQEGKGDTQGLTESPNGTARLLDYTFWKSKGNGTIKPSGQGDPGVNKEVEGSSLVLPPYEPPHSATSSDLIVPDPTLARPSLDKKTNVVDLSRFRFGQAGVWLRFFTIESQKKDADPINASVPHAVGYQIVRMKNGESNDSYRYYLMRSTVRPSADSKDALQRNRSTYGAGYDLFQVFATSTLSTGAVHTGLASIYNDPDKGGRILNDAGTLRQPNINQVIAENVIDFGVLVWGRTTDPANGGHPMDVLLFPSSLNPTSTPNTGFAISTEDGFTRRDDLGIPYPGIQPVSGIGWTGPYASVKNMTYGFAYRATGNTGKEPDRPCTPVYVDVFLRILDAEGARLIDALENPAIGVTAPQRENTETTKAFWWRIALEHSHIFTRRIALPGVQP
ncbi:MAG: hypothetical protein WCL04_00185 [Verrucomicrobiota bacterium]